MTTTTILFDLDGTLLPMDQDLFVKAYMKGLITKLAPYGYDPQKLTDAIWSGITAMVTNSGKHTNEVMFWNEFVKVFGEDSRKDASIYDDFYKNEFQELKHICGYQPLADKLIKQLKADGYRVILATNPLFPRIATESRVRWAGLDPSDFELITTYENSRYCKPNLDYYKDILTTLGVNPQECLMVGNDVSEDMVTTNLGMNVFLLTDCLINKNNTDISTYPNGNFSQLFEYMESLD